MLAVFTGASLLLLSLAAFPMLLFSLDSTSDFSLSSESDPEKLGERMSL